LTAAGLLPKHLKTTTYRAGARFFEEKESRAIFGGRRFKKF